ncbi:MAG TPA: LptF/LptG family permease [Anaeromyxobacteraceae bacterium]|nr:LptF/LptG family permease [Anaeromyxobacteraceae bacterium]
MDTLDRYLAREILLPFAAGLLFLTQLLLASQLLAQADVLFGGGVSAWDVIRILADLVPHVLEYVLPVAFLLGAVLGVGRLAEYREIVALSAAGISPVRLVRVPLLLGVAVSAVAMWIALQLAPAGLRDARGRIDEVIKRNLQGEIRAGVFYEDIPGFTLYAAEVKPDGFRHVLIADRTNPSAPVLALSERGRFEPSPGGSLRLVLDRGELHREEPASEYIVAAFDRASVDLGLGQTLGERNRLSGSAFELTPAEIRRAGQPGGGRSEEEARGWRTFLWRRIAVPLGILALGLLAVPISAMRRGGRAFGYGVTLLAVVAYYSLLRFGEKLSHRGTLPPWLGPNVANLAVAAVAIVLLAQLARRGTGAVK